MDKQNNPVTNSVLIREKAEKLLNKKSSGVTSHSKEADVQKLIHELEVYKIELEMQFEEIKQIKEKEIELANNKYLELYDFAPTGYFTLSKTDTIIDLNLSGAEMLGDERSYLMNGRFGFFVSAVSKPNFSRFLEKIFNSRTKESCEVILNINDHIQTYIHLTGIASDNNEHCFVTAYDFTERMQTEIRMTDALLEAERFREALDHVSAYIYMKDTQSRYIYANRPTLEMFGCTSEELVGCDDTRFFPPDTVKRLREVDSRVFSGEQSVGEIDVSDPVNGRRVFLEIKNPLFGYSENNEIIGLMGISTDITERKQADEALHKSEEQFHSLFDNMGEGVALHELVFKGKKPVNYRFIDINKSFVKTLGLSREQVVGKLFTEVFGVKIPPYLNEYAEVAISKNPICFETYYASLDKHFAISAAHWQENGFATIFMDITDRKKIEKEIILKNEELQKINVEQNKFFSIIAHDLRSPFNSFLGLTEYMAEEMPDLTTDVIQEIVVSMRNSATNLYRLLENLLQWAKIQQDLIPFNPELIELSTVFDESMLLVLDPAKIKEIELVTDIPDNMFVFADRNMLLTVIRNLISNALKFTPKNGKITVSAKSTSQNSVQICIKDTGIGMNENIIKSLFRLDGRTNRNGTAGESSTGLGLLLCKEFAEKNGGKIWVESEDGKGSTFYFTVPVEEAK